MVSTYSSRTQMAVWKERKNELAEEPGTAARAYFRGAWISRTRANANHSASTTSTTTISRIRILPPIHRFACHDGRTRLAPSAASTTARDDPGLLPPRPPAWNIHLGVFPATARTYSSEPHAALAHRHRQSPAEPTARYGPARRFVRQLQPDAPSTSFRRQSRRQYGRCRE